MSNLLNEFHKYAEKYTTKETNLLQCIKEDTHKHLHAPHMLSGHLQGKVLSFISCLFKPKYILEIGTFSGYSAICLAEGIQSDGTLYTIEKNKSLESRIKNNFSKSKYNKNIKYLIGNAIDIVPSIDVLFDIVYIDADKKNYSKYYELILSKLSKNGIILVDNVWWKGRVNDETILDSTTKSISDFNNKIHGDNRVENIFLPIRDGLMIIKKI